MRSPLIRVLGSFLILFAPTMQSISQSPSTQPVTPGQSVPIPENPVLYTGQLDGLLGSKGICAGNVCDPDASIRDAAARLFKFKTGTHGILVGMGDNFAPFGLDPDSAEIGRYKPQNMIDERLTPHYSRNPLVGFMATSYDAVVPGKEDFAWGVEYLRGMTEPALFPPDPQTGAPNRSVPLIANNLVVQALPDLICRSYPSPTPALPLQPNQVSSPISTAGAGAAAGGGTGGGASGGGGGKGKGKGGGGKGGGASAAGAGAASGGAAGAGGGAACPSAGGAAGAAGAASAAGATTAGSSGSTTLSLKQAQLRNLVPRPSLLSPDSSAFYPWTFSIALSVPDPGSGLRFETGVALVCPADADPSKIDTIEDPKKCVPWFADRALPFTFGDMEERFALNAENKAKTQQLSSAAVSPQSAKGNSRKPNQTNAPSAQPTATKTFRFTLINRSLPIPTPLVPVRPDGKIYASSAEIAFDKDPSDQTAEAAMNSPQPPTGILFPGNSVKVCLDVVKESSLSGQSPALPAVPAVSPSAANQASTPAPNNSNPHRCTASAVSVQRTLFKHAWVAAQPTVANSYVIFGALASDTLNGVSDANKDWAPATIPRPARPNPTMQISVLDPTAAITQALTAFNQLHRRQRFTAIVLAQMTAAEAKSLADSFGSTSFEAGATQIDLIVSEADPVATTPQSTVTVHPPTNEDPQRFIPVVSPAPIFQKADCVGSSLESGDCIAVADISFTDDSMTLENSPAKLGPSRHSQAARQPDLAPNSNSTFCDNQAGKITWECRVLAIMRTAFYGQHSNGNPEIAILEARDFDYIRGRITPDLTLSPATMPTVSQETEALWNSGNLTRVTLLGSTLTTILTQNRSNQSQTYQTIASVQRSQQLRILGIFQVGQTYYINGIPLDSTKLYSVATSDNLATTTSDYSSLASIDQNPPEVFWTHSTTLNIADIIYQVDQKLFPPGPPAPLTQARLEAPYGGNITPADRKQAAPQLTPFALSLVHSVRTIFSNTSKSSLSQLGERAQLGPLWHFTIQQMSIGFSNSRPSQSDQLIGSNLGGVSNPNVVSPHSDTLTSVADMRVEYYFHRGLCPFCVADVGIDGQFNFTRSIQGSTTPVATPLNTTTGEAVPTTSASFPANTYLASPFVEFQMNAIDYWKPIVLRPAFFTANVASVKQFLNSGNTKLSITPNLDFELDQKRTVSVGQGIGTRFEASDFTYGEVGLVYQRSYNILSDVSVGQTVCALNSATSLSTCAARLPAVAGNNLNPSYSTYNQKGGYMLASWTQEFPKNPFKSGFPVSPYGKALFLYQATAFGNFFAYGSASTSSVLTRYAFALNNTLQVQLPANFTFGPSYNWFFFQANQHGIGSSLHRSSINAQLSYSFDWHNGMSRNKSIIGKVQ